MNIRRYGLGIAGMMASACIGTICYLRQSEYVVALTKDPAYQSCTQMHELISKLNKARVALGYSPEYRTTITRLENGPDGLQIRKMPAVKSAKWPDTRGARALLEDVRKNAVDPSLADLTRDSVDRLSHTNSKDIPAAEAEQRNIDAIIVRAEQSRAAMERSIPANIATALAASRYGVYGAVAGALVSCLYTLHLYRRGKRQ